MRLLIAGDSSKGTTAVYHTSSDIMVCMQAAARSVLPQLDDVCLLQYVTLKINTNVPDSAITSRCLIYLDRGLTV
jgi:hypothetical protein